MIFIYNLLKCELLAARCDDIPILLDLQKTNAGISKTFSILESQNIKSSYGRKMKERLISTGKVNT